MKHQDFIGFSQVDLAPDPDEFIQYLDTVSTIGMIEKYKRLTYELLGIATGSSVLDVGCGTGNDVVAMAKLVGGSGRVVGTDSSRTMIAEARKRAAGLGLPIEYVENDAHSLSFGNTSFDVCRADRVLTHVTDPQIVFGEMLRVTRSGGKIAVVNADHETIVVDMPDRPLTRRILNFQCDNVQNGWMGRHLYAMFTSAGLVNVTVVPATVVFTEFSAATELLGLRLAATRAMEAGVVSSEEGGEWIGHLERASATGRFFGSILIYLVVGQKGGE